MIEDLPDVPPALLLLVRETVQCNSWEQMRKRIKDMLRELRDQSEAYDLASVKREGYQKSELRFEIHLHGALDLLSGEGCIDPGCRFAAADRLARSVGLIADRVWLTDLLSGRFIDFGRVTNKKLDEVIVDTMVLTRLLPLVLAGVVKFRPPWIPTCAHCSADFDRQVETASDALRKIFRHDFRMERCADGGFVARTGQCLSPPLIFRSYASNLERIPTAREFAERWITDQLRGTFWVAREAALGRGAVFSNSRIGLAGLAHCEGRLQDRQALRLMDGERNIDVPWVSDLDAMQIVQLRQEASSALPAFREKMAKALCLGDNASPRSVVHDLREQAMDVRSELDAKRSKSARYWKTAYGLLGLGLSAYGVATDQVAPGVGDLLPIIQLLIGHKAGHESDVAKLESRPGYVLVKAQEILAHTH